MIWTERYRPQDFFDVKGQKEIVARVEAFVKQKDMPHLLFTGPAGVGKSTLGILIAKKMFGDMWRENYFELNASDERGIDVIRNKVKGFARTKAIADVPFKIIFLDESDALTREAQQALRRVMENYTTTCRFILSCNYSSKIIDPIQSRCSVFRFKPLTKENISDIIEKIAKAEGLKIDDKSLAALFEISEGDCRRVINMLQSSSSVSKKIDEKLIFEISAQANPKEVREALEAALARDFLNARELLLATLLNNGLSGLDMIKQIQKEIWNLNISDEKKVKLIEKCGETEFRMVEGSDEFIQLEALLASFYLV